MDARSLLLLLPLSAGSLHAQAAFTQQTGRQLSLQAQKLLAEARQSASGSAGIKLATYPGHSTMLTARVKSGGAELHQRFNDIFIALEGDATEVTGGIILDQAEGSSGELHGSRIEGGERHAMHKGDVIHIAAGVPHQTLVDRDHSFVYYVIKVEAPK